MNLVYLYSKFEDLFQDFDEVIMYVHLSHFYHWNRKYPREVSFESFDISKISKKKKYNLTSLQEFCRNLLSLKFPNIFSNANCIYSLYVSIFWYKQLFAKMKFLIPVYRTTIADPGLVCPVQIKPDKENVKIYTVPEFFVCCMFIVIQNKPCEQ